jgi:hypothetical protein
MYLCVRGKIDTSNTQIHERSLSWLDTSNTQIHERSLSWLDTPNTQIHERSLSWLIMCFYTVKFFSSNSLQNLPVRIFPTQRHSKHVLKKSERSSICVLGVSSQESERSYICVLGVSSQENEHSCICVLGVSSQESERS